MNIHFLNVIIYLDLGCNVMVVCQIWYRQDNGLTICGSIITSKC